MSKVIHNNIFFKLNQPKIFHLVEYQISNDDPVRKLSEILEAMNFNKLMQVFSHKTKIHPVRMFAVILYAYSRGIYSTRDIEIACHENIKFRFLLQNSKIPDHSTISRFLTKIENLLPELFEQFFKIIFKLENISMDTIYIDGTKIEAYANKYTFVWRGSIEKYSLRLDEKIETLIFDFNNDFNTNYESFLEICAYLSSLNIKFVKGRGHRKSKEQKYFEKSKTRKFKNDLNRVENLIYDFKKNKLFRKDGLELNFLYSNKKGTIHCFFNPETEKKIKYNAKFRMLSDKSKENISSDYGKQLQLNRSIQVEGAFAVLKEDMKLRKLKVRGKTSVLREIGLFCMGYNFNRYISRRLRNCKGTILHPLQAS